MQLRSWCAWMGWMCVAGWAAAQTDGKVITCANLHLVPAVRECSAAIELPGGDIDLFSMVDSSAADRFILDDLDQWLASRGVRDHVDAAHIVFLDAGSNAANEVLTHNHLTFDPVMHDEGYVIALDKDNRGAYYRVAVIAETQAGFFYGAQTLKQLVRGGGPFPKMYVPTVRDWPAMPHRGLSDDWSRGPLPNMEFLKREIRTLAAYKYNIFSPYFENTFAYASTPVAAFPGGAMTPDEARELVQYAARYHITVIPEQESFGHLHTTLRYELYSPVGETPHGAVLAPGDANTLPMIGKWFGELAAVFPAPYAHIGADETEDLGLGRTRERVAQEGLDKVYLDFLGKIHATLAPLNKRLLFWGDIAVKSPELVGTLPKDMIAVPWDYDAKPDFTKEIVPFTKTGLETWVAPGVNNWSRLYPNNVEAMGNIRAFVRDGQRLGATGMLNTVWNDDGEGIFDENWFGVLFGAAAAWQPGEASEAAFTDSYGLAFHGDATGKISQAQRELMEVHRAMRKADLEDAKDEYFWLDPYSAEGESAAGKLRPILSEIRQHAERAVTLVAEARTAAKAEGRDLANPEALDALELGARRIDAMAMKFQFADDAVNLYARARALTGEKKNWDEVEALLATIGETNGRFEDIRDSYTELGVLYSQAWLRDNRPHWLGNNQARYEKAAELWIGRGDRWNLVMEHWRSAHTLPAAGENGLPLAK